MKKYLTQFWSLPIVLKAILIGLLVFTLWAGYEKLHDFFFESRMEKVEKEKAKIDAELKIKEKEIDILKANVESLKKEANDKVLQDSILQAAIDEKNRNIKNLRNRLEDASRNYENDTKSIKADNIDNYNRCLRLVSAGAEQGYEFPANYCDKYRQ